MTTPPEDDDGGGIYIWPPPYWIGLFAEHATSPTAADFAQMAQELKFLRRSGTKPVVRSASSTGSHFTVRKGCESYLRLKISLRHLADESKLSLIYQLYIHSLWAIDDRD